MEKQRDSEQLSVLCVETKEKCLDEGKEMHIYICGAKGISQYGGFESFVQKLLKMHESRQELCYHVACKQNGQGHMQVTELEGTSEVVNKRFSYCNADCFLVKVPDFLGSAQAVFYDLKSLKMICKHISENQISSPVVYILSCRIGPFMKKYVRRIHERGGSVLLNPDGHEWKRRKWSKPVQMYWRFSERKMVACADYIVCDNRHIEQYIQKKYQCYNPKTSYISYGAEVKPSCIADNDRSFLNWMKTKGIKKKEYYLAVGRLVEENNYDVIIREFMKSKTKKKLVLITTSNSRLTRTINQKHHYEQDNRIVFVDSVYNPELLKKIRENAYANIHGHEVGGTNPSLLEALASTKLNLVYGVCFNAEVAGNAGLYWTKDEGNLAALIERVEKLSEEEAMRYECLARERIQKEYAWEKIAASYEELFRRINSK